MGPAGRGARFERPAFARVGGSGAWVDRGGVPAGGTGVANVVSDLANDYLGIMEVILTVTPEDPIVGIEASLNISSRGSRAFSQTEGMLFESLADFGNTAFLDVLLPDGFTFTSLSGVFLSEAEQEPPAAVPEPTTGALLGLGTLLLFLHRRRQSHRFN